MSTTESTAKSPSRLLSSLTSSESAFARLVVGPLLFLSFIVSLLVIDRKTSNTVFSSPHSHTDSPTNQGTRSNAKADFYHSHQKKLARQEVEDAFQLRGKVIAGMTMAGGIGVASVGWMGLKMWSIVAK